LVHPRIVCVHDGSHHRPPRDASKFDEILSSATESYKKEITAVREAKAKEDAKHKRIMEQYLSIIDQLREKYELEKDELTKKQKKKLEEYTKMYYNRPEELKRVLEEKYGLSYVDPKYELELIINEEE
jgi:ribosome-binding protein aMBF1 (putative translation factor)